MTDLVVNVHGRMRRKRLVLGTVRVVMSATPIIGRRRAVAISNRVIGLLRFQYRIDRGPWQRMPLDWPRLTVER